MMGYVFSRFAMLYFLLLIGGFLALGCSEEDDPSIEDLNDAGDDTDSEQEKDTQEEKDGGDQQDKDLYPETDLWPEVESLLVGDSMFVLCFGTNKDFRDRFKGTHSFYVQTTIDHKINYQKIKESVIAEVPYGVLNYTVSDPTNVEDPEQNNVICAGTILMYNWENYWHWFENYKTYEDFKFNMAMTLIDRMEADLATDFSSHIEVMEIFTPHTMHGFSLNPGGSIFGWSMIPEQSIQNRMPQQTPIDNLLLAGAWTYPGGGQSISIISGMLAGMKILEKEGEPIPEPPLHEPRLRGVNAEWFDNMGIRDQLTIECSEIMYNSIYADMCAANKDCEFTIPADPEEYRLWLKTRYPDEAEGIDRLFQKMYDLDKVVRILMRAEYSGKDTNDPTVMGELVAELNTAGEDLLDVLINDVQPLMEGKTLSEFMKPYTSNAELISIFTLLAGMAGEGPDAVDAISFVGLWTMYHLGGFCYTHGGSQAISDAFAARIRSANKIRLNSLVTKIDIDENGRATQVRTADGTCYKTKYVISNANAPDTFFKMVGYQHLPTPEIDADDPYTQFHPGRIWQAPISEKPSKPVDVRSSDKIDQLSGATPEVASAKLTSAHAGWQMADCLACHTNDAHPVKSLGNNAAGYTDAQCSTCHGTNGSPIATASNHTAASTNDNCGTCHAGVHQGLGYQAPDDCRACHKYSDEEAKVGDKPECVITEEGYDVVIIGAGAGGLGAGTYLTNQGYNIVVLERHHKVGGYMTNFNRGQYRFEVSTHGFDGLDPRPLTN